jgi:hypothetical protein
VELEPGITSKNQPDESTGSSSEQRHEGKAEREEDLREVPDHPA